MTAVPLPRRAFLALPAVLIPGYALAVRAQDQPATPAQSQSPVATQAVATPAATVDPSLVGAWVVSDIGAFIESGLMDVTGVRKLTYRSAEGALTFTFSPDGAIAIVADAYRIAVSAEVRFVGEVDTAVSFAGELAGRYTLLGEILTVADVTRKDLVITAETPVGDIGIDNDDVFAGGTSRLVPNPDGATLRLYPDPENQVAIILTRQGSSDE